MRETIDWRDELQRLVELYREELGEEIATFLLSIPTMARLPLGKLARIGKEAGWGEVTMGYNLCVPKSVSPNEALLHIYESPSVSSLGSEYLEVNYQHYTLRFSTGDSRLWRIAYYTVLAWHQEHTPELPEPTLPTDPKERLPILLEQIRNAGPDYDMSPVLACLSELGERHDIMASTHSGPVELSTKRLLTHCEQNDTLIHYADRNTVCFTLVGGTRVEARISDHINTVVAEILARCDHLALKWPD